MSLRQASPGVALLLITSFHHEIVVATACSCVQNASQPIEALAKSEFSSSDPDSVNPELLISFPNTYSIFGQLFDAIFATSDTDKLSSPVLNSLRGSLHH